MLSTDKINADYADRLSESKLSCTHTAASLFIPRTAFRSCVSNDGLSGHRIICRNDGTVNECVSARLYSHSGFMAVKIDEGSALGSVSLSVSLSA